MGNWQLYEVRERFIIKSEQLVAEGKTNDTLATVTVKSRLGRRWYQRPLKAQRRGLEFPDFWLLVNGNQITIGEAGLFGKSIREMTMAYFMMAGNAGLDNQVLSTLTFYLGQLDHPVKPSLRTRAM